MCVCSSGHKYISHTAVSEKFIQIEHFANEKMFIFASFFPFVSFFTKVSATNTHKSYWKYCVSVSFYINKRGKEWNNNYKVFLSQEKWEGSLKWFCCCCFFLFKKYVTLFSLWDWMNVYLMAWPHVLKKSIWLISEIVPKIGSYCKQSGTTLNFTSLYVYKQMQAGKQFGMVLIVIG